MCGIAGILSKNIKATSAINIATDAITHRGPQGRGYFVNEEGTVALGHSRLCIIDLSEAAAQPLSYGGRYQIIYNGEIYNYIELRETLLNKGYNFHSASDTEVVVAAFAAYGRDCLQHFEGMFAFAIWDEQEQELFAARDRMGEKPFFFAYDAEKLVFGSEMKVLWAAGVERKVNNAMLYNFLTIDYTSNPYDPGETFFQDIQKLPAASFLIYSLSTHQLEIENYWQVTSDLDNAIKDTEAIDKLRFLLSGSVEKSLRSDVPVGTSLSGGLDSSAIVALCNQKTSNQYTHQCFTAVFPGFERDEYKHAASVANAFGLTMNPVEIKQDEVVELMQKAMYHQEEPSVSASMLAQYKVYEIAKQQGVTVLLDGQGADEILGGYDKYYKWYWRELYSHRNLSKSRELSFSRELGNNTGLSFSDKTASLFPQFAAALHQSKKKKDAGRHHALDKEFAQKHRHQFYYSLPPRFDLNSALYFSTFSYGLEELLKLADRNSMAQAVEVRLPFLNHKIVDFLFTLPPHFKIRKGWTKWLLRKAMEPQLPPDIVWRKDKVGFEPPQKMWMQNENVQESIMEGKKLLVNHNILVKEELNKKIQPHDAYAAENKDWKFWSASFLFRN
jgi:asparagine synthase (glutamine-hydrolysing)